MKEVLEVVFRGGKKVDANVKGFTIKTDQPERAGGGGSAPSPFDLFLASIGTCAGIYALGFCQARDINTDGMRISLSREVNQETKMVSAVEIKLHTPKDFPEKYEKSIIQTMNMCAVKKHLENPPKFTTVTTISNP